MVVYDMSKNEEDLQLESTQVVSAFHYPWLRFNSTNRTFYLEHRRRRLFAPASSKGEMYRDRFSLLQQRVKRNKLFSRPMHGTTSAAAQDWVELTPLESLLGTEERAVVMGMVTQQEAGQFFLEDGHTRLPLDLHDCGTTTGIFTEHSMVVAQGVLLDGVFKVETLGFPPPESRQESLRCMSDVNFWGDNYSSHVDRQRLHDMEVADDDAMFVVLSDVHLDKPEVMEMLGRCFEGFDPITPSMFILVGNFTSRPFGQGASDMAEYTALFDDLCSLICRFPNLASNSRFVFVPGPNDPGAGPTLPRAPLPKVFTRSLRESLAAVTFTSNPCRIRFYTQEIVLFREDILRAMRSNAILPLADIGGGGGAPVADEMEDAGGGGDGSAAGRRGGGRRRGAGGAGDDDFHDDDGEADGIPSQSSSLQEGDEGDGALYSASTEVTEHLVKTLLDQGHLCPLPQSVRPVHWEFDSALRLYPLPDVVILADHCHQYQSNYEGCATFNPGSFPSDYSFVVYRPARRETEFSKIELD